MRHLRAGLQRGRPAPLAFSAPDPSEGAPRSPERPRGLRVPGCVPPSVTGVLAGGPGNRGVSARARNLGLVGARGEPESAAGLRAHVGLALRARGQGRRPSAEQRNPARPVRLSNDRSRK